jgi:hypothetical protein
MLKIRPLLCFAVLLLAGMTHAHCRLDYPAGGETFFSSETITVRWAVVVPHHQKNWDLLYSINNGQAWDTIQMDIPVSVLSRRWPVPNLTSPQMLIRIIQDDTAMVPPGGENPSDTIDYAGTSAPFTVQSVAIKIELPEVSPIGRPWITAQPNPFHGSTLFTYSLPQPGPASLVIFAPDGRKVFSLTDQPRSAGLHSVQWTGLDRNQRPLSNGIYLGRLKTYSGETVLRLRLTR